MDHDREIVLVTGVSSQIGNTCATLLAKKGFRTYGACRDAARYTKKADEFFELVQLDPADEASVAKAAAAILGAEGRLDHLVCCGEVGLVGSVEGCTIEEARRLFEADYLGTLRLIKAFLPSMREAGSGRIIVVTSLAARIGIPFLGHYSGLVRALEALVESLRLETRGFGLMATCLEIGLFGATIAESNWIPEDRTEASPYRPAREILDRRRGTIGGAGSIPFEAAKVVCSLLGAKRLPAKVSIASPLVRLAVIARRLLPERIFESYASRLFRAAERKE